MCFANPEGGLGIPEIGQLADEEAGASEELTGRLSAAILDQDSEFVEDLRERARDKTFDAVADELAEGLSGGGASMHRGAAGSLGTPFSTEGNQLAHVTLL